MHNGKDFTEIPSGAVCFVYSITIGGGFYYGKKNFYSTRKKPFGKKELAQVTDKRKKTYHTITTESDWKTYCSSSDKVKKMVTEGLEPIKIIERICYSIKEATYYENKMLYNYVGMVNCINDSISGKIYREEIQRWGERIV